ncbi:YhcN/YlaJ family sporulation lipoprotein [Lentibacillus sp. Marseille-P4043]|uniref:YhcN/YlaJ family sporulation lipoprotein n=1 Tax=Lentibacillus sp. Marseille-P4043 TaxID=2040293 RepID=UPI00131A519E|nr:YhcN/YlaJ family sporulation lipoprotein [Lentibacillus sp. Marseille-P4043]
MDKLIVSLLFTATLLVGCTNSNEDAQSDDLNTQSVNYETDNEQESRLGERDDKDGYPQSDQSDTNAAKGNRNYSDIFVNDESDKIYNQLIKRKEIKQAQVASVDDKVVVAVMLNDHTDHNIRDMIEQETQKIVPNKQIVVYTDDIHWDRVNNLKARLGPKNAAENVKDEIKDLFNMND